MTNRVISNDDSNGDYNRPRRPNADTLSYLRSLPLHEKTAYEEIEAHFEIIRQQQNIHSDEHEETDEQDFPQILSAAVSAVEEVQNEIASLAGDEFGSQSIESIVRIVGPHSQLCSRKLLFGISGYLLHLSTHRYGSHVVQTIIQSIAQNHENSNMIGKSEDIALEIFLESDQQELPEMRDLIVGLAEELLPYVKELAEHICGCHVIRSLLCLLAGLEEVLPTHLALKGEGMLMTGGNRRGKVKKKKKKKKTNGISAGGVDNVTNNASFTQLKPYVNGRIDSNDVQIQNCFTSYVRALAGVDESSSVPGELQRLACHPTAGPLLILLLRILTHSSSSNSTHNLKKLDGSKDEEAQVAHNKSMADFQLGIHAPEPHFQTQSVAEKLAKRILCWNEKDSSDEKQTEAGNVIYGLSGEIRGSHLLEIILRSSSDSFFAEICDAAGFLESDALMEYVQHDVSNYVIQTLLTVIREQSQATVMVKSLESLIANGYLLNLKNKRRGVLWRCVEMCAKFNVGQDIVLLSIRRGFSALSNTADDENESRENSEQNNKKMQLLDFKDCIPYLVNLNSQEISVKGRVELNAPGARSIYHLLHFDPHLCGEVLMGIITKFDVHELEYIANDGRGSRCIIDPILDGPCHEKPFKDAIKKLLIKLSGRWVALSVERIGHHAVKKMFFALHSMEDKATLCSELSKGINRLNGNAIGRSIIVDCAVKEYMDSDSVWKEAVKKKIEKDTFIDEIVGDKLHKKRKRKRKNTS